jgi:hypothetical protein
MTHDQRHLDQAMISIVGDTRGGCDAAGRTQTDEEQHTCTGVGRGHRDHVLHPSPDVSEVVSRQR